MHTFPARTLFGQHALGIGQWLLVSKVLFGIIHTWNPWLNVVIIKYTWYLESPQSGQIFILKANYLLNIFTVRVTVELLQQSCHEYSNIYGDAYRV